MELIVEGRGSFLGKHQGRLRVNREQKMITEVPLIHLDRVIIIDNGVSISSDVIRVCSEEGIPIHFMSSRGNAIASLFPYSKRFSSTKTKPALYQGGTSTNVIRSEWCTPYI